MGSSPDKGVSAKGMPVSVIAIAAALAAQAGAVPPAPAAAVPISELPTPSGDPLRIDRARDPVLRMGRESTPPADFMALVEGAVERAPVVAEAAAGISEAEAAEDEARTGLYPTAEIALTSQRSLARNFETDDINNVVERSRARGRSDLTFRIDQTLYDFGATEARIAAAGSRLRAAAKEAETQADRVALRAIASWYDVFAYRAMVTLGSAFTGNQNELRTAIETRIRSGVSAPGDLPRVESYIATAETDLARYRRQLANAEARFTELFGVAPPADLGRAPIIAGPTMTKDSAQFLARSSPEVVSAEALARAAQQEVRSLKAQRYPQVSAGIDAGKYGVFDREDYDVRGRVTVRQRFFGGINSRVNQGEARAEAAEARASRVRSEAEREASIAWSDVQALEQQLAALENSYIASRQSRDVLAERFRIARGTLFDLLESESGYFGVAATYIRSITELDAARYVLLSRTGQLLPTLQIEPPALEDK